MFTEKCVSLFCFKIIFIILKSKIRKGETALIEKSITLWDVQDRLRTCHCNSVKLYISEKNARGSFCPITSPLKGKRQRNLRIFKVCVCLSNKTMYELKTLLPKFDIELPTCMYTLRSNALPQDEATSMILTDCNGSGSGPDVSEFKYKLKSLPSALPLPPSKNCVLLNAVEQQIQQILKSSNTSSEIEKRQEQVLQQLNELKSQLAGIRSQLGLCQKGVQHTRQYNMEKDDLIVEDPLHDIVINAHPNFIPYALLALRNAWSSTFNIEVKVFAHSTVPDIGDEAKKFQEKLCAGKSDPTKRGIKVTLIWTDCEHTEMIMSPTMYVPIYGEVNIIRYLGRVGPAEYRYETTPICNEIDLVLDICYQFLRCNTAKAKADIIRVLNSRLQKEKFFGGDQVSVADIGVYSSMVRMKFPPKDLTPALKAWHGRVKAVILL